MKRYSEDCLVLSEHMPRQSDNSAQLPVMVWCNDSGVLQDHTAFVADVLSAFGNVIVLTVNYMSRTYRFSSH